MFFFEIMAMYVEGAITYFKDKWNWIDCLSMINFMTYYASKIYIDNNPDVNTYNLTELARILEVFILLFMWLKISWFLKL